MSDVKDPSTPGGFGEILAAAGVAPLRKPGEPARSAHVTPATRRESRDQLQARSNRRARNRSNRARRATRSRTSGPMQPEAMQSGAGRPKAIQPKASAIDWAALGLSVVVPPAGLLLSVAAHIADRRRVGWASTVTKVATGVGCVLTLVVAAGTVVVLDLREQAAAHDAVVASSAEFCSAVNSVDGTMVSDTFGWPAVGATIPATITAMEDYTARWTAIAAVAPEGIQAGAQSVATAGQTAVDSVTTSRTVDNPANVARMQAAVSSSGITTWVAEYCQ